MKITICGLAGTGTSTLGKQLASEFQYDFCSSGDIFRAKARELEMELNEFEELCRTDERYDKELDHGIADYGRTHENCVVESRLAWYFIPDSFKVKLRCDHCTRVRRVSERDNITTDQAEEQTLAREAAIRDRYNEYYSIEAFDDDEHFDLVLDSTATPVSELVAMVRTALPLNNT